MKHYFTDGIDGWQMAFIEIITPKKFNKIRHKVKGIVRFKEINPSKKRK